MEKHLSPIIDIIAHSLHDNEFQKLVKLKDRAALVDHYLRKKKGEFLDIDVPETTYIFSEAMPNLQVSFVKHFNHIYERTGTLVAGRYSRQLITSEDEMKATISRLNIGIKKHN